MMNIINFGIVELHFEKNVNNINNFLLKIRSLAKNAIRTLSPGKKD